MIPVPVPGCPGSSGCPGAPGRTVPVVGSTVPVVDIPGSSVSVDLGAPPKTLMRSSAQRVGRCDLWQSGSPGSLLGIRQSLNK